MVLSNELFRILACPKCRGQLNLDEENSRLECGACSLRYRVTDGIPVLLLDEAEEVEK